jgi:hypothetical protein
MKITKDIRELADKERITVEEAQARGLRERAEAFRRQGGEIYQPTTPAQRTEVAK